MKKDESTKLEAIETILKYTQKIKNNPFSEFPEETLREALDLLEEFGEENNIKSP